MKIPIKMRIDNASNIYLASLTKKYASLFRLSITLNESVEKSSLQIALNRVVKRIPNFKYTLSSGPFWWYLKRINEDPSISKFTSLKCFSFRRNKGYLFKVSIADNRIVLDVFHALTDGTGALIFLVTLVTEYLRIRHGIYSTYNNHSLDPATTPCPEEIEDSFTHFIGKKGELERNSPAYHIPGKKEPFFVLNDTRIKIPIDKIREATRKYDCTVTDLITSAMIAALQDIYINNATKRSNTALKVSIPVNLRPIFNRRTFRNFSSYVNVGIDVRNNFFEWDQILTEVKLQKQLYTLPHNLEPKIAKNVELENNFAIGCIPLFLKKPIIDFINKTHGDKFCSQTLSNLGVVQLPDEIKPYILEMDFILGRQRGTSGAASCISCNNSLILHFTRNIKSHIFEEIFVKKLLDINIPVEIEHSKLA